MNDMRVEEFTVRIWSLALRDSFGGVGRVLVREVEVRSYGEIIEASGILGREGCEIAAF